MNPKDPLSSKTSKQLDFEAAVRWLEGFETADSPIIRIYATRLLERLSPSDETCEQQPVAWRVQNGFGDWRFTMVKPDPARAVAWEPLYVRGELKAFVHLCAPHGKDWLTCPECAKAAGIGNQR